MSPRPEKPDAPVLVSVGGGVIELSWEHLNDPHAGNEVDDGSTHLLLWDEGYGTGDFVEVVKTIEFGYAHTLPADV